jgi:hypothetical protein
MILLKSGAVHRARKILECGSAVCPFALSRDYFRTALCVARLQAREFASAAKALDAVTSSELRNVTSLLRVHASGESHAYDEAREIYQSLAAPPPNAKELYLELGRRYIERSGNRRSDAWLIEREIAFLMAA